MSSLSVIFFPPFFSQYLVNLKLEGWLSIPEKKNKRRHDWKRQYVVVSNQKIFFYNTTEDKATSKPSMI